MYASMSEASVGDFTAPKYSMRPATVPSSRRTKNEGTGGRYFFVALGMRSFCASSQLRSRTSAASSLSIILRERYEAPLMVVMR